MPINKEKLAAAIEAAGDDLPDFIDLVSYDAGANIAVKTPDIYKHAGLVSWPVVEQAFCLGFLAIEGATVEELMTIKEKWENAKTFLEAMQEERKL
jgi:hypothetical protein